MLKEYDLRVINEYLGIDLDYFSICLVISFKRINLLISSRFLRRQLV